MPGNWISREGVLRQRKHRSVDIAYVFWCEVVASGRMAEVRGQLPDGMKALFTA